MDVANMTETKINFKNFKTIYEKLYQIGFYDEPSETYLKNLFDDIYSWEADSFSSDD